MNFTKEPFCGITEGLRASDFGTYVNLGTLTAYPRTFTPYVLILKMYIYVLPRIMNFTRCNEKFG